MTQGGLLFAGGVAATAIPCNLAGQSLALLTVASAGSIGPMLSGPIKAAIRRSLTLDLETHAQGADSVAQTLVEGSLRADVFLPITAEPMQTVLRAGKADAARPIARTEMVLVYSPKSRFVRQFEAAERGEAKWWEVLQEPGLRFARSNPAGDPGGRNIIFTMMLAAKKYGQSDLVQKVLGPTLNPEQILTGGSNQQRLQTGELDASGGYKVSPGFAHLPFVTLPNDINLSGPDLRTLHPEVSLDVAGKTFYPETLLFYAAVLKEASNLRGAIAFTDWLMQSEAQDLFRQYKFGPPGKAAVLHA